MNKFLLTILLCITSLFVFAQKSPYDYVNPMIGTKSMGHTFPGAVVPFGAIQLSPNTNAVAHNIAGRYQKDAYRYCAGYQYDDTTIMGFAHTHLSGTGHSDLGDILIMPQSGNLMLEPSTMDKPEEGYRSRFSHESEVAQPAYYEVMLQDYNIKAQLTASPRVGVHKYTFQKGNNQRIILDLIHGIYNYDGKVLWSSLRVENDTLITGYRITNGWSKENHQYFAISFSKPIINYGHREFEKPKYAGFWRRMGDRRQNFPEIFGRKIVSYFEFDNAQSDDLVVKVALSAVSTKGALNNLNTEATNKSFEQILAEGRELWNKKLNIITANGSDDELSMLYTSLYHTMINPSVYMDVDGKYRGLDGNIHTAKDFTNYTVFSIWDTYRTLHPLYNLIQRKANTDFVNSMLAHYSQSVHKALPVWSHMGNENWCMIGYHAVSVLSDAVVKGLPIDKQFALEAVLSSSNIPYYDNTDKYLKYGYVPNEYSGSSASVTLEYSYDDWTIYNLAKHIGNDEVAKQYKARAFNYQNIFDESLGFARPRLENGDFKAKFDLLSTHGQGFIEGNSWNYSFHVPHDVVGLMHRMGGEKQFISKLDSLFTMHLPDKYFAGTEDVTREGLFGCYVHGNEPSHHIPYFYAWTSQAWKTQKLVRNILTTMYRNKIDGLCGNDDCGQMSAWYVMSAMGMYPVCPGSEEYILTSPYLPYMNIKLENGKEITIKAEGVSDKNCYIKSIKLNGKPYNNLYIKHSDIQNGCELEFTMSSRPNKSLGAKNKPYSLTQTK